MSLMRDLETTFVFFGFRKCSRNEFVNFKKIDDNKFLVIRIFNDSIADLLIEIY